jgi:hypothetical protein
MPEPAPASSEWSGDKAGITSPDFPVRLIGPLRDPR